MLQGARPGRIFGKEILCACGLTRTSIDYVRKLSGHSLVPRVRLECNQHQDCAKARPTDFGEHGGKPKGDVAAMQTFSMGRLYVGGFLFGHPDACSTKGARIHEQFLTSCPKYA